MWQCLSTAATHIIHMEFAWLVEEGAREGEGVVVVIFIVSLLLCCICITSFVLLCLHHVSLLHLVVMYSKQNKMSHFGVWGPVRVCFWASIVVWVVIFIVWVIVAPRDCHCHWCWACCHVSCGWCPFNGWCGRVLEPLPWCGHAIHVVLGHVVRS